MDGCPIKMPIFNGNFPARSCRVQTRDLVMLTWTTSQALSWRLGLVIDGILMDSIWSRDNWSRGWGAKSPGVVGCDTSWVWRSTTGFWDTVVHFQTNSYYPPWEPLEWTFIKASGLDFELAEKPTSAENVDIGYSRNSKFVAAWFQGRLFMPIGGMLCLILYSWLVAWYEFDLHSSQMYRKYQGQQRAGSEKVWWAVSSPSGSVQQSREGCIISLEFVGLVCKLISPILSNPSRLETFHV